MRPLLKKPNLAFAALILFSTFAACNNSPEASGGSGDGDGDGDGDSAVGDGDSGDGDGDLIVNPGLGGDTGNPGDGDGDCNEEAGTCMEEGPPPEPACGDGRINVDGETCDDENGDSGDGCTANCKLEANFVCPTPASRASAWWSAATERSRAKKPATTATTTTSTAVTAPALSSRAGRAISPGCAAPPRSAAMKS